MCTDNQFYMAYLAVLYENLIRVVLFFIEEGKMHLDFTKKVVADRKFTFLGLSTQKQFIFGYRKWSLNKNILYYPYQNIRVTVSYIPFPDHDLSTTRGHVTCHSRKSLLVLALDQILLIKCKVTWSNVQQRNRPLIAIPLSGELLTIFCLGSRL